MNNIKKFIFYTLLSISLLQEALKYFSSNSIQTNCLHKILHASHILHTHIKGSKTKSHLSVEISIKCFNIFIGFWVGCKVFQSSHFNLSFHIHIQLSIKLCISAWVLKFHLCHLSQQATINSQLFKNPFL